jgi:hypothetical protein
MVAESASFSSCIQPSALSDEGSVFRAYNSGLGFRVKGLGSRVEVLG